MPKTWKFDPNKKSRCVQSFDEFASSPFASETLNGMENTHLGSVVVDQIAIEKTVGFSREPMIDCYGQYIPAQRNLKKSKHQDYSNLDSLIVIDIDDVDSSFLPFILSHEGFHAVQDRPQFSGLVPMYNNGVIYNAGVYQLADQNHFVRAFKTMERSCDVVAICVTWEMKKKGINSALFNELANNPHTQDMARLIEDVGEWASDQPRALKQDVMDHCMFWGNMAGLWSKPYNDYLDRSANKTFRDTQNHVTFSTAPKLKTAGFIEFAHFSLISPTFGSRKWAMEEDFNAIEKHALSRQNKAALERSQSVQEAIALADDIRRNPSKYPEMHVA